MTVTFRRSTPPPPPLLEISVLPFQKTWHLVDFISRPVKRQIWCCTPNGSLPPCALISLSKSEPSGPQQTALVRHGSRIVPVAVPYSICTKDHWKSIRFSRLASVKLYFPRWVCPRSDPLTPCWVAGRVYQK